MIVEAIKGHFREDGEKNKMAVRNVNFLLSERVIPDLKELRKVTGATRFH
jgi:hypothetical protein